MPPPIDLKNCVLLADLSVLIAEHAQSDYPIAQLLQGEFSHLSHLEWLRRFAVKHGYSTPGTAGWHAMQAYQAHINEARRAARAIESMLS